jgi:hypothetical protein
VSKQQELDARLQNVLTVIQSVTPPSLPADAEVMTRGDRVAARPSCC